jgi:MFS family permease
MVPLFWSTSVTVAALCLTMALFLSELVTAPLWAVAMDLAPRHAATSSGIMNTGLGVAASVSPPVIGWIVDVTGSWHGAFALSMVMLAIGPFLAVFIRPDRPYLGEPVVAGTPPGSLPPLAVAARRI